MRFDSFGSRPTFLVTGDERFKSCFGAFIGLLVATLLAIYGSVKMITLVERGDTIHQAKIIKNHFDSSEYYNYTTTGFNLALNLFKIDWSDVARDFDKYVQINAYTHEWGFSQEINNFIVKKTKVELKNCDEEDIERFKTPQPRFKSFID